MSESTSEQLQPLRRVNQSRRVRSRIEACGSDSSDSKDDEVEQPDAGIAQALQDLNVQEVNRAARQERLGVVSLVQPREPNPGLRKVMSVNGAILKLLNFDVAEVFSLAAIVEVLVPDVVRGRPRSVSNVDAVVILLHFLKSDASMHLLAGYYAISSSLVGRTILIAAAALHQGLKARHCHQLPRPRLMPGIVQDVALLVDTTFVRIPRGRGSISSRSFTYNAHKHCYCFKKEVAVEATAPHRALFWTPAAHGGTSDRTVFVEHHAMYAGYLVKTIDEHSAMPGTEPLWSVLGDAAYLGSPFETPGVRMLAVTRKNQRLESGGLALRQELKQKRVYVEHYFGRLKGLWGILRGVFRYDDSRANLFFDLCLLLTNRHIVVNCLEQIDFDVNRYEEDLPILEHQYDHERERARQIEIRSRRAMRFN